MGRGKGSHNLSPFFYRKGKGRLRLLYLLCNAILMIVIPDYGTYTAAQGSCQIPQYTGIRGEWSVSRKRRKFRAI